MFTPQPPYDMSAIPPFKSTTPTVEDFPRNLPVVLCAMKEEADAFLSYLQNDSAHLQDASPCSHDAAQSHDSTTSLSNSSRPVIHTSYRMPLSSHIYHPCFVRVDVTMPDSTVSYSFILGRTGIGMANAASATSYAIHTLKASQIIFAGTAGGLASDTQVRDIVIGDNYVYGLADATAFDYERGQIPQMPPSYFAHQSLSEKAYESFTALAHTDDSPLCSSRAHRGQMLTSDAFVTARNVDSVRQDFPNALSTDMESCAAAQICFIHNVPFVSVRAISDLCSPQGADEFHINVHEAAALSAQVVHGMFQIS